MTPGAPPRPPDPTSDRETLAEALPAADLERRFLAFALDRLIAWTVLGAAGWLAWWLYWRNGEWWAGFGVLAAAVLLVLLGSALALGLVGVSPGRLATGLRVVDQESGSPVGVPRALLRTLVLGTATLPTVGLGAATLAWTAVMDRGGNRRGWHDHLTGSVVVDVRRRPEPGEDVSQAAPRQIVNLTTMRLVPAGSATPVPAPPPVGGAPGDEYGARPGSTGPPEEPAPVREAAPVPPPKPAPASPQLGGPLRPDTDDPPSTPPGSVAGQDAGPGRHRGQSSQSPRTTTPGPRSGAGQRWRVSFDSGEMLVVEGLVIVGRKPEPRQGERVRHVVALPSSDMSLSKTHAQLHLADGVLVVTDRGSTNGSVLNRRGVARDLPAGRPATLVDGDRVRFGDREMRVESDS